VFRQTLFLYAFILIAFSPNDHKFPDISIRIKHFQLGLKPYLLWLMLISDTVSSVMILQLWITWPIPSLIFMCYSQWPSITWIINTGPSFESLYPSINFPLAHISPYWTVILPQISLVFAPSDHKSWITDHCSTSVHSNNGVSGHIKGAIVLPLLKRQWKPTGSKWGKAHILLCLPSFSMLPISIFNQLQGAESSFNS
jgi:hypothetical protein